MYTCAYPRLWRSRGIRQRRPSIFASMASTSRRRGQFCMTSRRSPSRMRLRGRGPVRHAWHGCASSSSRGRLHVARGSSAPDLGEEGNGTRTTTIRGCAMKREYDFSSGRRDLFFVPRRARHESPFGSTTTCCSGSGSRFTRPEAAAIRRLSMTPSALPSRPRMISRIRFGVCCERNCPGTVASGRPA